MVTANGNLNRHLGGKIAARTTAQNNFIRACGADMLPGHNGVGARRALPNDNANIINGVVQFDNPPAKLFAPPTFPQNGVGAVREPPTNDPPPYVWHKYKFVCPHCLAKMDYSEKAKHRCPKKIKANEVNHDLNGNVPSLSTKKPPEQSQNSVGAIRELPGNAPENTLHNRKQSSPFVVDNNTTNGSKLRKDSVKKDEVHHKFSPGDTVWVNGLGKCRIKTDRVKRTIADVRQVESGRVYYKIPIGTGSNGKTTYHWYPEADEDGKPRIFLFVAAAPATPPGNNNNNNDDNHNSPPRLRGGARGGVDYSLVAPAPSNNGTTLRTVGARRALPKCHDLHVRPRKHQPFVRNIAVRKPTRRITL